MKARKYAVVAAALLLALLLAGCGGTSLNIISGVSQEQVKTYTVNGQRITCIVINHSHSVGLSCDWAHPGR